MTKPLVGLNCTLIESDGSSYYKLDRKYVESVERAGGIPLLLPFVRTPEEARGWLDRADAVLFTGGGDLNPARWGEPRHEKADLVHPDKEASDFLYADEALRRDVPVLGICLGSQLLNVALGGSLHQHIGDDHRKSTHEIRIVPSRLRDILGSATPTVNSYHHQAVHRPGRDLSIVAHAPDGTVEGFESGAHRFVLGVQWHPEHLTGRPEQLALFQALVDAGRR